MNKAVGPGNLCYSSRRKKLMFIAGMSRYNTHISKTRVIAPDSLCQVASHGNRWWVFLDTKKGMFTSLLYSRQILYQGREPPAGL